MLHLITRKTGVLTPHNNPYNLKNKEVDFNFSSWYAPEIPDKSLILVWIETNTDTHKLYTTVSFLKSQKPTAKEFWDEVVMRAAATLFFEINKISSNKDTTVEQVFGPQFPEKEKLIETLLNFPSETEHAN